jgi:hypothetical protein
MLSARLGSHTPPRKLDRSNDGQDHTVLPYAHSPFRRRVRPHRARSDRNTDETNFTAPLVRTWPRAHRDYPPCPHLSCRRCRVHRKPGSQSRRQRDRPSGMSRDGRQIRQNRISVRRNILYVCIDTGVSRNGQVFCPTGNRDDFVKVTSGGPDGGRLAGLGRSSPCLDLSASPSCSSNGAGYARPLARWA